MKSPSFRTLLVQHRHSWRHCRTQAAINGENGLTLITMDQLAARLAGGFLIPIDPEKLRLAMNVAIENSLGELDEIKQLPGFQRAAVKSLTKTWQAGINLASELAQSQSDEAKTRLESMVILEREVLSRLPKNQCRPADLARLAINRVTLATNIFGSIEVLGQTEIAPVWRRLLGKINEQTQITWNAGPSEIPTWVSEMGFRVEKCDRHSPELRSYSCANPSHEISESLRWARKLIVDGIPPQEIAISTASPETWDAPMLGASNASALPIHFIHGQNALSTAEGQLTAALAEVLLHGFSRSRVVRLVALLRSQSADFRMVPGDWGKGLEEAPLLEASQWQEALTKLAKETLAEKPDSLKILKKLINTLNKGRSAAAEIGEALLQNRARSLWIKALQEGPADALDITLARLRVDDHQDPDACIAWGPAAAIAATPRPYTWLLGLSSRSWPRRSTEDPLLPDHVIAQSRLDPSPVHELDRLDFRSIRSATRDQLINSRSRRDSEGRLNGVSPLYPQDVDEVFLAQSRTPEHAASPSDRLLARPEEFNELPLARSAKQTWADWYDYKEITIHDGLIRPNHPLLVRSLNRVQSATSLVKLLRDPLGYLWSYGFGWSEPEETDEPLTMDALAYGNLLHELLESTVNHLTKTQPQGLGNANEQDIEQGLQAARKEINARWNAEKPIPPPIIWETTLDSVINAARTALNTDEDPLVNQRSWTEVPFGNGPHNQNLASERAFPLPWDPTQPVVIPGTHIKIAGSIDRLDLGDGEIQARVTDYKSGKKPLSKNAELNGGQELQRCLYAFAVKSLLTDHPKVQARLIFPRLQGKLIDLEDPDGTLERLAGYINAAAKSFVEGKSLSGPSTESDYYDLKFALPEGASNRYLKIKAPLIRKSLAKLEPLWREA